RAGGDETAAGLPKASGGWGSRHRERCRDLVKVVAEEAPSGGDGEGADGQPDGRETNQVDAAFSWFRRQRLQRGLGAENPQKCRRKGHEGNSNRRSLERILQAETGLDVGEVEAKPEPGGVETPRVAHERKRGAEYDRYAGSDGDTGQQQARHPPPVRDEQSGAVEGQLHAGLVLEKHGDANQQTGCEQGPQTQGAESL